MADVDLTEFYRLSRPKKKLCVIGALQGGLSRPERAQLAAACAQDSGIITAGAIQGWLAARKIEASIPAITVHRKGTCTCADQAT